MQILLRIVIISMLLSGCAAINSYDSATDLNAKVRIFPSPLVSESDFINLVSDDSTLRDQALRNVAVYYNCIVKTTPTNYQRKDPTVINQSQIVAFSEIPDRIRAAKMEKLAGLVTSQNRSMQSIVDAEIKDLGRINWGDIKKEVNSIIAGAAAAELQKNACPMTDSDLQSTRIQVAQGWLLLRPPFFPPFM